MIPLNPVRSVTLLAMRACAVLLVAVAPAATAEFRDPLDTPARLTVLAPSSVLNAVARAGDRLVAVGPHGRIVVSDDRGARWQQVHVPTSVDLVAVQFPTPIDGWAVGHGGIVLSTNDAGTTWTKRLDGAQAGALMLSYYDRQESSNSEIASARAASEQFAGEGSTHPFLDLWFESARSGFVIGPFNLIFRTDDGGQTWVPWYHRVDNPRAMNLNAIRGVAGEVWIVGEQGLLLRLDRSKQRFIAVPPPYQGSYFGLVPLPHAVIAFGMRGNIFRSADGGVNWSRVEAGEDGGLTSGTVLDDGRVVIASMSGALIVSTDGGASFTRMLTSRPLSVFGIAPVGGANAIAVAGLGGIRIEQLHHQ